MKSTALSVDSAVARMVRLVEEAQNQRSDTEMLVEKIAKYYTPGIIPSGLFNSESYLVRLFCLCRCKVELASSQLLTHELLSYLL